MSYKVQVENNHYFDEKYVDENRMLSYSSQIDLVRIVSSNLGKTNLNILEIGLGNGIVRDILKLIGHNIETLDIDKSLKPDIVSSLPNINTNKKYDCILACEVLEHIKFSDVKKSFKSFSKITNYVIISVPDRSIYLSIFIKLPIFKRISIVLSLPFNHIPYKFNGQHYWELGSFGISSSSFVSTANIMGFECVKSYRLKNNPWHHFFLFRKKI